VKLLEFLTHPQTLSWVQIMSNALFLLAMSRIIPYAITAALGQVKIEFIVGGQRYESQ
jgi:hypothetical protein